MRHFQISNDIFDGYIKHIGWQGTLVYMAIKRHWNSQTYVSFPSYKKLSEELGVHLRHVSKGIKILLEYKIIEVTKRTTNKGRGSNIYTFTARKEWKEVGNWSNQKKVVTTSGNI